MNRRCVLELFSDYAYKRPKSERVVAIVKK